MIIENKSLDFNPNNIAKDLAVFAKEIYGEGHEVIECELWGPEEWKNAIKKECPNKADFLSMTPEKRLDFKIQRRGLGRFVNIILGVKGLQPCMKNKDFNQLADAIYG